MTQNNYDRFAQAYQADNDENAWNAYYERPAVLNMVGDVNGLRVLDAGCGGGAHTLELVDRGASVVGIDLSEGMLDIARNRLATRAKFERCDLGEPLPFGDASFDVVLASLVMHYLEDWSGCLGEFNRILSENGRLVFSTHHPFMDHQNSGFPNYFETYQFSEKWRRVGRDVELSFWHRPLHAMFSALKDAGFQVDILSEPEPDPRARTKFPKAYQSLTTEPRFLFFAATKQ